MNSQIIAVGDTGKIKEVIRGKMHVEKDGTVLVHADPMEHAAIIGELQRLGILACSHLQYEKLLKTNQRLTLLQAYDTSTVYDWQKRGCEYFGIVYSGEFDLCAVEGKEVEVANKVAGISRAFMSRTGAVIAFTRGLAVSFHVNKTLDRLLDVKLQNTIEKVVFDATDCFIAIAAGGRVHIYDLKMGKELFSFKSQDFFFARNKLYVSGVEYPLEKNVAVETQSTAKRLTRVHRDKIAHFVDGKTQKVIFDNMKTVQSKNHNNIADIKFYFSADKLYAVITKDIGGSKQYIIETYSGTEITMNRLDSCPKSVAVSNEYFVVFNAASNLVFYQKQKYNYVIVKNISKQGEALVSSMNGMTCVYDAYTRLLEFYDRVGPAHTSMRIELRSVYTHIGCTDLSWSESGLYLAACSMEDGNCLLQIFNCNGNLIYRKTYNEAKSFEWRSYIKLSEAQKIAIGPMPAGTYAEAESEAERDVTALLSEWKAYLMSQIQKSSAVSM